METRPVQEELEEFGSMAEVVNAMLERALTRHSWKGRKVVAVYGKLGLTAVTTYSTIRERNGGEKGAVNGRPTPE